MPLLRNVCSPPAHCVFRIWELLLNRRRTECGWNLMGMCTWECELGLSYWCSTSESAPPGHGGYITIHTGLRAIVKRG